MKNKKNYTKKNNKKSSNKRKKKGNKKTNKKSNNFKQLQCAAQKSKKNTCYNDDNLIKMRDLWNLRHPEKKIKTNNTNNIWKNLKKNMNNSCNNEKCWLNQEFMKNNINSKLTNDTFAPSSPASWKMNPNEWLSNFDISKVMKQYEKFYNNFVFIGPSPIDFNKRIYQDKCVWNDLCNFNLKDYINNGKKYIGIIFNTDPHNKSGSHWISLYINLEKKFIFFFDSNGDNVPKEIVELINRIKTQGKEINIDLEYDNNEGIEHQLKNTECGIYSIYFITSLLTGVRSPLYFKKNIIRDPVMEKYRKIFFNDI